MSLNMNKKGKSKKTARLFLAGDHAGFKLKEIIKSYLAKKGFTLSDFGPLEFDNKDDYPDYVIPMAKKLAKTNGARGLIIAGSGQGEAIATNKIKGIRAGIYHGGSNKIVKTGREHDDTNILCIGSRFMSESEAKRAINIFLNTEFQGGRHSRRLKKVSRILK